ncbi:hypothetical protein XELAEV_18014311mg [Xenopus laevis]|uniref:Uncharacterized protein n=1 Tax=Xenopus laevis TaxID=8355 RepID=A0A974DHP5_XENLA|nr:hypothetical protein XELAEV_18014311mg [Xenopus laevis]
MPYTGPSIGQCHLVTEPWNNHIQLCYQTHILVYRANSDLESNRNGSLIFTLLPSLRASERDEFGGLMGPVINTF